MTWYSRARQWVADKEVSFLLDVSLSIGMPSAVFRIYGDYALSPLIKALDTERGNRGYRAAEALAKIGPAAVPALTEYMENRHSRRRDLGAYALRMIADRWRGKFWEKAVPALTGCLRSGDVRAWHGAAEVLERIGLEKIERIDDRVLCLLDLRKSNEIVKMGDAAIPMLAACLKLLDEGAQKEAARALGKLGLDKVETGDKVLCLLLSGKMDEVVRMGETAVHALAEMLRDGDAETAAGALATLAGKMDINLEEVRAALREFVDSAKKKAEQDEGRAREKAIRAAKKEASGYYNRIMEQVRRRAMQKYAGMAGMMLEGETPKPPAGKVKGMYRAGRRKAVL